MADENVCDSCKRHVLQRIGHYQGKTVNCCAYGCDRRNANGLPCERNDVIRYLFEQLKDNQEDSFKYTHAEFGCSVPTNFITPTGILTVLPTEVHDAWTTEIKSESQERCE